MVLVDRFGLDAERACPLFEEYNARPDGDPESDCQLEHKLASALAKVEQAGGPRVNLLDDRPAPADAEPGGPEDDPLSGPPEDPHRLARCYRRLRGEQDGIPTLSHWRGDWWQYERGAYRMLPEGDLRAELVAVVKEEFDDAFRAEFAAAATDRSAPRAKMRPVTGNLVANVLQALASECRMRSALEQPSWTPLQMPGLPPGPILPTRNALVHLPTGNTIPTTAPTNRRNRRVGERQKQSNGGNGKKDGRRRRRRDAAGAGGTSRDLCSGLAERRPGGTAPTMWGARRGPRRATRGPVNVAARIGT